MSKRLLAFAFMMVFAAWSVPAAAQLRQPRVAPGPGGEPDWSVLLDKLWGLDLDRDLRNPVLGDALPAVRFVRADRNKPATFTPVIALGLETKTRGGWYARNPRPGQDPPILKHELWSYAYKQPADQQKSLHFTPPSIAGQAEFEPGAGDEPFGLW
ncbi:MAG: hypothetical protein HRF43_09515, partial [Phycisphaerae bacterium]